MQIEVKQEFNSIQKSTTLLYKNYVNIYLVKVNIRVFNSNIIDKNAFEYK